ncbi:MAG: PEGA domain-containing protein [Candidatus Marinimicrobia bacterium]|nr:PEGA domain-containing protein [Candidatus Neomarinimicrobiota bacterium]
MKKIILLVCLFIAHLNAQERIAVLQFDGSGVDEITAKNISKRFSYYLSTTNRFEIVEREMIDRILEEQKFQNSGCVADECAVEIGELIGVNQIVAGSVDKILDSYSLNIKLVDVATGKIIYQDMDDYEGRVTDFIKVTIKNMAMRLAAETKVGEVEEGGGSTQYASTKKGKVVFNVDQNNVAIFIDGQYNSRSSGNQVVLSIAEGPHTIKFSLSSFKDWEKNFNVLANEEMTYDVKLIPGIAAKVDATTGILLVRSTPSDAPVFVDGIEKGMTTLQIIDIGVGDHEIRVEKNLYYAYTEIVTIHPDIIGEVKAILKPNFGSLSIKSNPTASVVMINGQAKGKTPYSIDRIKSGTYVIQVSKDLYHTHEESFIITDGSLNTRNITLTPAFGKLIVKTTPMGAKVKIDGQSKGITPFELDELPSGNYHLSLTKDLYQSIEQDIVIDDGKTFNLNLKLEPRSGLLSISGSPNGASIFANGQKIGHIPVQDFRIAEGMVELTASYKDYHSQLEFLNIQRDQIYEHVFNLERHTGKLIVITEPPDAEIYLDKEGQGNSPKILDGISVGIHTIDIQHPSFLAQSETFTLTLNEKKNFRFKLMTYDGSIQQDIDREQFKQRASFSSSVALALLGFRMQTLAVKNYDAYLNASSSDDAADFYNNTTLNGNISNGSFSLAGALLLPALKFTWDIGKLKKQLNKR